MILKLVKLTPQIFRAYFIKSVENIVQPRVQPELFCSVLDIQKIEFFKIILTDMIHDILIQNKPDNFILCNLFLLVVLSIGLPFQNECQLTDFHLAHTVDDQN